MGTNDGGPAGPFYHGTKVDLRPGDLIRPGYRSNYGHAQRTSPWVYMTATLSALGAELARGEGRGRLYIVEPTGPFTDDPDLTDKKFPGNPTRSYRSRHPLRVVGEVTDWQPHPPEVLQAMLDGQQRLYAQQAARVARIPCASDVEQVHAQADELARAWAPDARYQGALLLMRLTEPEVHVSSALRYESTSRGKPYTVELPRPVAALPHQAPREQALSGRLTDVTAWREGWAAVIESCVTEIGLSQETRLWVAVDGARDTLTFQVDSDGPHRSWRRSLRLVRGVLSDDEHGGLWDFPSARLPEGEGAPGGAAL